MAETKKKNNNQRKKPATSKKQGQPRGRPPSNSKPLPELNSEASKLLKPEMEPAILLMAEGRSNREIAQKLNFILPSGEPDAKKIYRWRRLPAVQAYLHKEIRDRLSTYDAEVFEAVRKGAVDGNSAMARLFLQLRGIIKEERSAPVETSEALSREKYDSSGTKRDTISEFIGNRLRKNREAKQANKKPV